MITPIIGLEVHVELKTKSKMFCGCDANHFHAEPNTHTCPVCLGLPGALPVPNKKAIDWCIKLGLALSCTVNRYSFFERKNYFYPDLSKGYQISQYQQPFCVNGKLGDIRINRVHMEEDTGKSVHLDGETLLDFNRSGVPLVEIVSEPDIKSPQDAKKYLEQIQQLIRYLGISDADIEKGSMRCEPTVNLNIDGHFTPLVEIKNVASLTGVLNAIQYEIDRQSQQFDLDHVEKDNANLSEAKSARGGKTTRGWDADKSETFLQREKEGSADYRYFPEPDIPPIEFTDADIQAIRITLPELPADKIVRFQEEFGLVEYASKLLADDRSYAELFEAIIGERKEKEFCTFVANILLGTFKTVLSLGGSIDTNRVLSINFSELFDAVKNNTVSSGVARDAVDKVYHEQGGSALDYIKQHGLTQVSDATTLEAFANEVIAANPKAVEDYKKNPLAIGFLVGQLMKLSKGSANPQMAKEILEKLILSSSP